MVLKKANIQLLKLYEEYNKTLLQIFEKQTKNFEGCSAPLLIYTFNEYFDSKLKVLIVGQETNGWGKIDERKSVIELQQWYIDFKLGQNANFRNDYLYRPYLTSPFWNFSRRFFLEVNNLDWSNRKTLGFLWTNISKIDVNTTTPSNEINSNNLDGFYLLRKEVKILKPDIVLFMIGEKYSVYLNENIGLEIQSIDNELKIFKCIDKKKDFPIHTYRINHPKYLYSIKKHKDVHKKLIEIISKQ